MKNKYAVVVRVAKRFDIIQEGLTYQGALRLLKKLKEQNKKEYYHQSSHSSTYLMINLKHPFLQDEQN